MKKTFPVNVTCDITAKIFAQPFRYRVYVNNELFVERTWIWEKVYLEESLPISASAGIYPIRFEVVDPEHGRIKVRNCQVEGSGRIVMYQEVTSVEILYENT